MTDHRKFGFLRPKERAYLADRGLYAAAEEYEPPARPAQTKSRIKNQLGGPGDLRKIVDEFRGDLLALTAFQMREADSESPYRWQGSLENAQPELKRLRDHLNNLIDLAERDELWSERDELATSLERLNEGLPIPVDNADKMPSGEEMGAAYEKRRERVGALQTILETPELPEILKYIGERGKCELPDRRIGGDGEPWRRVASRELVPELAMKESISNRRIEYELTDRGEVVLQTWKSLKNTKAVRTTIETRGGEDPREVVLELLAKYFDDFEI